MPFGSFRYLLMSWNTSLQIFQSFSGIQNSQGVIMRISVNLCFILENYLSSSIWVMYINILLDLVYLLTSLPVSFLRYINITPLFFRFLSCVCREKLKKSSWQINLIMIIYILSIQKGIKGQWYKNRRSNKCKR